MPKILWIKNKEPEVYAKAFKFITASTYLTAKLTGNYVVDRFLGLASFNPARRIRNTVRASAVRISWQRFTKRPISSA